MVEDFRPMMATTFSIADQAEKEAARAALVTVLERNRENHNIFLFINMAYGYAYFVSLNRVWSK